ncbi:MAG: hypothetical protein ACI8RZ_001068 [Myxococcota bacterium]|jgi:hypothetical protein
MIIFTLLSGAALAGSADGIDHELSIETGSMRTSDDTWSAFSYSDSVGAWGLRAGYGLSRNLTVVASWHRGVHDSSLGVDGESYHNLDMDFTTNQIALGPKVDYQIDHWLRPYGTVQGMGVLGRIQIDEDRDDDDSPVLSYSDTTFGGFAALGLDIVPGAATHRAHFGMHIELGYGKVFGMEFEDEEAGNAAIAIGDLDMQGLTFNAGAGVRF